MNPNQKKLAVNSLVQRCQSANLEHDTALLELVATALTTLRERAKVLEIELPELTAGYFGQSSTAVATQFALSLVEFQMILRSEYPELTHKQVVEISMADTFLGSAVGFDFRSEAYRGRVPRMPMTMPAEEVQRFIGEKLAEARKKSNLSQQALADLIGMSNSSVARIEAGKQRLGMSVLYRFLVALHLHPSEVLPPEAFPPDDEESPVSDEQIHEILEVLPQIEKKMRGWLERKPEQEKRRRTQH